MGQYRFNNDFHSTCLLSCIVVVVSHSDACVNVAPMLMNGSGVGEEMVLRGDYLKYERIEQIWHQ